MGNPVVNAIADFTMGQVTAPRVPTPTVDSSRMDISYRQYPFGYGTSQETASTSSYKVGDDDGGPRPYRGELNVKGIGLDVADRFVGAPRELSAAMAPVGFSTFMGIGSAMSYKNLTRIQDKQRAGEEGFAVGMLNGRIVGVSPGIGGSVLSGVLPEGLSHKQQQDIAQQLLEMSGPRPLETTPGLPGPTGDFPDRKTGITTPEAMFGVGQGGRSTPVGVSYDGPYPNYPTAPIPPAGDIGDETTSANIRFTNIGVDRPDYSYMKPGVGYTTTGSPDYAYQGDPGPDTGLAPAGGATTPRDDQDDEKPAGKSYSINDSSRNPADRGYSMRAKGGPVQKTGFGEGSPDNYAKGDTVADTVKTQVRENSFVLNAPTVERLQEAGLLPKGVDNSDKKTTIKANKGGLMPVALSKGEYVIEPEEAQRIGYSFLEKINDQGKGEVDRRQAMNQGGFAGTDLSRIPPLSLGLRPPINTGSLPEGFVNPQPSMPDTPLPPASTAAEPSTPLPERTSFEQTSRDLLEVLEDNKTSGYVPEGRSKSGVTIGIGFDIGQHSVADLERMGLSSDIIAKFTPYVNKTGQAAKNALTKDPLSLTDVEVEDVNTVVLREKYERFEKRYPKYANIPDEGKRAVMFSAFYGGGLNRYKTFKREFDQAQNMKRAIKKGLIDIIPRGAAEHNRARKALDWYNDYELENMSRPIPKPNSSATR